MTDGIVVLGAGHAGVQTAASLRMDGYEGSLSLVSAETDLPYQKPPLSKAFLKDQDLADPTPLRPEPFYAKKQIELVLGRQVTEIQCNRNLLLFDDGGSMQYRKLVLAAGSRVRTLELPGSDLDGVLYLRSAADARRLKERLARANSVTVLGGGFIGLEAAASARHMGKEVTVLEAQDRLMGRAVSAPVSERFLKLHRDMGTDVRPNTFAVELLPGGSMAVTVKTSGGEILGSDLVLIGVGVLPNQELAEQAGLECDNGIVVDEFMITSDSDIAAAGDCVSFNHWQWDRRVRLESVQNAVDQGRAVSATLTGKGGSFDKVPWFWSDQGEHKLQMAGLALDSDLTVIRGDADSTEFSAFIFNAERLVCVESVNRTGDHLAARKLLAAGISPSASQAADTQFDLKSLLGT